MDRCFDFAAANCVLSREVGYCVFPDAQELNDLKFENGSSSGSGDLSQKRRSDGTRNLSNHPEHNKWKISRGDHPQRSSGHGQITASLDRPFSSDTRQTTHNENHKNSGTTVTRCHRIEAKFVLIRPVRPPPKIWRDNRKYLGFHFDQKGYHPLLFKSARFHRRLRIHHHAHHHRPQWNCLK